MSHNFCGRKNTWTSVSIPKYICKCFCKYYYVENLLRAFRCCCLLCISPRLFNSSMNYLLL